ncbi:MAG: SCP2 sterol-binding domain-containing protein [Actinomycetota bacterium]
MALFKDTQEVYKYLAQIFKVAMTDPALVEKTKGSGLIVRIDYTDPDSTIGVVFDEGALYLGTAELPEGFKPNMELKMSADDGHRFWLGKLNMTAAMARGKVRAKGSVPKMLKLMPLAKPLRASYEKILANDGRQDLIDA